MASLSLEPAVIAKSSILLDVKPWDDETDMAKLEECVRSIQMDGLVWGQCKCCSHTGMMISCSSDDLTHHLSAELEMTLMNLKHLHTFINLSACWVFGLLTFILYVAKLVPVGYGIKKLQIGCVVEDDKVSSLS